MARKRRSPYEENIRLGPLPRHHYGKEVCTMYGSNRLCAVGGKYEYTAMLYAKSGSGFLPVSTSDAQGRSARTPSAALRNARRFLDRVHGRSN